jgi:hypothetical protein
MSAMRGDGELQKVHCLIQDQDILQKDCLIILGIRNKRIYPNSKKYCLKCLNYKYAQTVEELEKLNSEFIPFYPDSPNALSFFEKWGIPKDSWKNPVGFCDELSSNKGSDVLWNNFKMEIEDRIAERELVNISCKQSLVKKKLECIYSLMDFIRFQKPEKKSGF